jgi:hypothetical protein
LCFPGPVTKYQNALKQDSIPCCFIPMLLHACILQLYIRREWCF